MRAHIPPINIPLSILSEDKKFNADVHHTKNVLMTNKGIPVKGSKSPNYKKSPSCKRVQSDGFGSKCTSNFIYRLI